MLEGWKNDTVSHENRSYFSEETKCIVFALQHGGKDVTWKCSIVQNRSSVLLFGQTDWGTHGIKDSLTVSPFQSAKRVEFTSKRGKKYPLHPKRSDVMLLSVAMFASLIITFFNNLVMSFGLKMFSVNNRRTRFNDTFKRFFNRKSPETLLW